jgi:hypothetical protein
MGDAEPETAPWMAVCDDDDDDDDDEDAGYYDWIGDEDADES